MPNQPRKGIKPRSIKVSDDLWGRAKKRAEDRGEPLSEAIRKFLERYSR